MLQKDKSNYIVSSRVRLARNLAGMPFPMHLQAEQAGRVVGRVVSSLNGLNGYNLRYIKDLGALDSECLKEKHLISKELAANNKSGAVVLREDEKVSIMINEEDHIRAQGILSGFELDAAYALVDEVDDIICREITIAFDEDLGFLTACPTNLGTGMRASVMMFLPSLSINRTIGSIIGQMSKVGITVRGIYGEGSQTTGYLYQVSNNVSLGISEKDIIRLVGNAVMKIAEAEETSRHAMYDVSNAALIDGIYRAWGTLTNAYKLSSEEFMELIAQVKLGVYLEIIKLKSMARLDEITADAQPATLTLISGRKLKAEERDIFRAEYVAKALKSLRL